MRLHGDPIFLVFLCLLAFYRHVECWESYEMDLFDLVEEVNQNFYEVFGIQQNSDSNEVRKAYRKLSLQWHPDKNPDPEAEFKFRQIVGIYEVLKDDVKRDRYNKVLEFGLPDWRQPIYYFRRVRKLSFKEITIAISIIISIGHYFVLWAQYFERKLTIEDRMDDVKKMLEKKQKKKKTSTKLDQIDASLQEYYENMPSPKLSDTLPYRISVWLFSFFVGTLPSLINNAIRGKKKAKSEDELEESDEAHVVAEQEYLKKKAQKQLEASRLIKELNPTKIEHSDSVSPVISYNLAKSQTRESETVEQLQKVDTNSKKEWNDKQKADLIKAIVRFPAGSSNRWTKIAEFVGGRTSNECIQMEKQMKANITSASNANLNSSTWNAPQKRAVNITEEPTTRFSDEETIEDIWSQEQQKCLEKALKEIGKEIPNRWDLIAEKVPDKNKNECILRYKQLCASIKNKNSS